MGETECFKTATAAVYIGLCVVVGDVGQPDEDFLCRPLCRQPCKIGHDGGVVAGRIAAVDVGMGVLDVYKGRRSPNSGGAH